MRFFPVAAVALLACAAPATAQGQAQPAPVDYGLQRDWLCLPGRSDTCSMPLPTTALKANGYGSVGRSEVAKDPPVDCFYVYPTVSSDQGFNSDLTPSDGEEKYAVQTQLARFASVCRTYAPIYRQMTTSAVAAMALGSDVTSSARLAYGDVANAWRTYLSKYNHGRPFVLIGHSQGSAMLTQLIAREIEGKPIARQMQLAIIPGWNVLVPAGKLVGGTFKSTPLCSRSGETGCVIAWSSFREKNAPPAGAMFGYADQPGMTVGCVNPAAPGSRDWVSLDSYWYTRSDNDVPGGPIRWSTEGAPPTPYVRTEGLVSGRCINDGPRGYLSIRTNHKPGDKRTDHIGGEVAVFGMFLPGWGMHISDIPEAQGDLIRQVEITSPRSRTAPQR